MATRTSCQDYEQDLILYYYDEASDQERNRIEAHLKECPLCARFLDELRILLPLTVKADEPPEHFWQSYSRELRDKLIIRGEKKRSWEGIFSFPPPFPVPALAAALVLLLIVTFTLTQGRWSTSDVPPKEGALLEVLPMAENLEFYRSLEFLDSLDLLEDIERGNA